MTAVYDPAVEQAIEEAVERDVPGDDFDWDAWIATFENEEAGRGDRR